MFFLLFFLTHQGLLRTWRPFHLYDSRQTSFLLFQWRNPKVKGPKSSVSSHLFNSDIRRMSCMTWMKCKFNQCVYNQNRTMQAGLLIKEKKPSEIYCVSKLHALCWLERRSRKTSMNELSYLETLNCNTVVRVTACPQCNWRRPLKCNKTHHSIS